ncbi:dihydroxy-acid dehydratase [Devosia sp. A8/3-2]|nr:dihydroxy-acid dehydratase [Devosia sp. A8/3-2]
MELELQDFQTYGHKVPLLVNMQPAGEYLGEDFYHAGGVPAVVHELMGRGLIHENAPTVNGKTIGENCRDSTIQTTRSSAPSTIRSRPKPGSRCCGAICSDNAIMKTSVISSEFHDRYLNNPASPGAFEGKAVVFDGPEDYHHRIDDPSLEIDEHTLLFMRGAGPIGYPGAAEVVNMRPPDYLIKKGIHALACIGDGRQSGTSGSPSILNASPEAAAGGNLAILRTGDRVRIDLNTGTANILISDEEIMTRRADPESMGGYKYPKHQTPRQEIQRSIVGQLGDGAILKPAEKYQRIAQTNGIPRDNH